LALYTGRHASTFPYNQTMDVAAAYLKEIQANYVVVDNSPTAEGDSNLKLQQFIDAYPDAFKAIYTGNEFAVYQVNLAALP
jgi:hypothetical protein